MTRAKSADVIIRDFLPEDIKPLVDYWTQSSEEFWKIRGVDKSKLSTASEFRERYENGFLQNGGFKSIVTILSKERPSGCIL
jgi:hypothetical protein